MMMIKYFFILGGLFLPSILTAQSVELMPGHQFFFTDVQFLKSFDSAYRTTLFSRTRAQINYDDDAVSFFSGNYLNYTFKPGIGISGIGRINNSGSDLDVGLHYLRQSKIITFFALPALSVTDRGVYSWFSIFRYRPQLTEKMKLYTSLELFTAMDRGTHLASTQRIRLGLDIRTFQFGLAVNLTSVGEDWVLLNENYGLFVRKEF